MSIGGTLSPPNPITMVAPPMTKTTNVTLTNTDFKSEQTVVAEAEGLPAATESVIPLCASTSMTAQKPGMEWLTERQATLDLILEKPRQPIHNIAFSADICKSHRNRR